MTLPASFPSPGSATGTSVIAGIPASPLPSVRAEGAPEPAFADCLERASVDAPATDAAPDDGASVAPVPSRLGMAGAALNTGDTLPALAVEADSELPHTILPSSPVPAARRVLADSAEPTSSPDARFSLLAVTPALPQEPTAPPVAAQTAPTPAAGAGQGGPPLPGTAADDVQVGTAHSPQWFAAPYTQGSHPSEPSADAAQPAFPTEAPPPESATFALSTTAPAELSIPAAAPFPDSALMVAPAQAAPAQQAAAAPPGAPASAPLPAPHLHADTFPGSVATHIHWLAERGIGHAHIHLHPRELGPLDVHLTLTGDQLRADFSSPQPEVRQALEHSLPQLRQLLDQHGLQLAHADVGQHQRGQSAPSTGTGSQTGMESEPSHSISRSPPLRSLSTRHLLDAYA